MASAGIAKSDGKIFGNVLVLGSMGSWKMTLIQEMASNFMFGELRGVHWISKLPLLKQREAEIDLYFTPKFKFYSPQDEDDLQKTFDDLENINCERMEKIHTDESDYDNNGMDEYVKRDSLVLDDVSGLADQSKAFVTFMTTCKKFGYS